MIADAALAYLHFLAIVLTAAFLAAEIIVCRKKVPADSITLLGRLDLFYFASAMSALMTGLARLIYGAKGVAFYLGNPFFYVKIGLFLAIGLLSILPTLQFIRWGRAVREDAAWRPQQEAVLRARRFILIEIALLLMIPLFAVLMARGVAAS
jgi:putative membrane protein